VIGYPAARRYAELVERLTGDTELVPPGLILELDRPEWSALKNEILWSHGGARAALAGNFSSLTIRAFSASRVTVVTDVLIINAQGAAQSYKLGETNALGSDSSTVGAVRDQRRAVLNTRLSLRAQAGDALASLPVFSVPAGGTLIFHDVDWPLMEQTAFAGAAGLTLQGGVVAQEVSAYFWGYERALIPEERVLD